jgi:hypothetical protein
MIAPSVFGQQANVFDAQNQEKYKTDTSNSSIETQLT